MTTDSQPESELCDELIEHLNALGDRCIWHREVRMLCWTHAIKTKADVLRIDFVIELDGRLLGIEVKAAPDKQSDLGRDLLQCAQYAHGIVAPAQRSEVPQAWQHKPLAAVFLRTKITGCHTGILEHFRCAHRLYGPANVGFVVVEQHCGLVFRLCSERFWTARYGYHQGMVNKVVRVGNGNMRVE